MRRLFILILTIAAVISCPVLALADSTLSDEATNETPASEQTIPSYDEIPSYGDKNFTVVNDNGCVDGTQGKLWTITTGKGGVAEEKGNTATTTEIQGETNSGEANASIQKLAEENTHTSETKTDKVETKTPETHVEPGKVIITRGGYNGYATNYTTRSGDQVFISDNKTSTTAIDVPTPGKGKIADQSKVTLHADGKIEVDYGDSRLVLYNLDCTTDDCLAERGSQLANIIANETKSLEVPEIDTGTEGKWEDHGYWEWEWIPPTGEFIPAVISTSWSVSWNDVETTFDLDLHQNATSSGTGSNGTEDSMEWKETTGSATVRYKKVHDYTDYIWTIINPEGQWVETHSLPAGETVQRILYSPPGTWSCVVVPRHYYHIERVIDYMITGTRYKKIPVYKEECDTCYDYDPVTGEKIGEHDCDCGDVFDHYEIESESLESYNGIQTDIIQEGIDMDEHNKQIHYTDVPLICIGCPGIEWCVGCELEKCDDTDRYICDDNANQDEIVPYAYLIE